MGERRTGIRHRARGAVARSSPCHSRRRPAGSRPCRRHRRRSSSPRSPRWGLAGLEFGEGIPGTVGGGLLMNAGAFGGEIGRVVDAIETVTDRGEVVVLPRERLGFTYRRLELPMRAIVTAVRLRLERGVPDM